MCSIRRMSWFSRTTLAGFTVFVAALAGSCRISMAAGPNLVANGGLETVDQKYADRPRGFRPGRVGKAFSEMTWTSPGHNSRRCVSVTTKDSSGLGYWQTLVTVEPRTTYTISLDYRARAAALETGPGIPHFPRSRPGGPNLELGMLPSDATVAGQSTTWSDIGIALDPVGGIFLPLATEWSRFQHTFKTRAGQTQLVVKLRLCHYAQQAWFDNLSVVEGELPRPGMVADPLWADGDTTPPAVFRPSPLPNTKAARDTIIRAVFSEDGSGVDPKSARVLLDGKDVTSLAVINAGGLRLSPAHPLAEGPHRVSVSIADRGGLRSNTLAWQFGVGRTLRNTLVMKVAKDVKNWSTRLNSEPFFPIGIYAYSCQPGDGRFRTDQLIDAVLLLKAGHFNAIRACQHVQMPEVREILDRLGIMSQQDQGAGGYGSLPDGIRAPHYVQATRTLTRSTYNNPGVVLLSLGNEGDWPAAEVVRAGIEIDPQRIYVPISGRFTHSGKVWDMPAELRPNAIDDGHPYSGWYGGIKPQTWSYESPVARDKGGGGRMVTLGEFGAEAMDAYETMQTYPPQFAPPPADQDTLWACSQVQKHDVRQIVGFGRKPANLGEYIEASQNYQEALLADCIIQMRLLPRGVAGYFHFHFMDVVPVFWPKAIVSHDHRPKKAYYQIAQINQPVVVLPRLGGARPDAMTLWVCNDLDQAVVDATVTWKVSREGGTLIEGRRTIDVPAVDAIPVETIDLKAVTWKHPDCDLHFTLTDADGRVISHYRRRLRCVPAQLLEAKIREQVADPFGGLDQTNK